MCIENLRRIDNPPKFAYKMFFKIENNVLQSICFYQIFDKNKWSIADTKKEMLNEGSGRISVLDITDFDNHHLNVYNSWAWHEIWLVEIKGKETYKGKQFMTSGVNIDAYLVDEIKPIRCVYKKRE